MVLIFLDGDLVVVRGDLGSLFESIWWCRMVCSPNGSSLMVFSAVWRMDNKDVELWSRGLMMVVGLSGLVELDVTRDWPWLCSFWMKGWGFVELVNGAKVSMGVVLLWKLVSLGDGSIF